MDDATTKPVRLPVRHVIAAGRLAVTLTAREDRVVTEREVLARATGIGLDALAKDPSSNTIP